MVRRPESPVRRSGLDDRSVWITILAAAVVLLLTIPSAMLLGVEFTYTLRTVTFGGLFLGAVSGAIGSFAVLRKQSLLGDALSHAALPGVGVAFLVAGRSLGALLIGATIASLLGVWFISMVTRHSRIKQDTAMGIVLAGWFALGIGILAFIQQRPDASQAGLDSFIFGQAAAIVRRDVGLLAIVGSAITLVLVLTWKEFKLVAFDPDFAKANGFRVGLITGVLLFLIVVAVVMGLQLAGVVLMVGLLIAPGIAARQWVNRLEQMVVLAAILGAMSGGIGAILSALDADIPTGPMIIVVASILVAISLFFAPGRGVFWSALLRRRNRQRFAAANALKTAYQHALSHDDPDKATSEEMIVGIVGSGALHGIRELVANGDLAPVPEGYVVTKRGVERAQRDEGERGGDVSDDRH